jgi:uncharacterized membrane protein YcjF (UPF0283 family)
MERIFTAAADVPTGIPTGIPPVVTDAASKVMADSPAGALLILTSIALIVAVYLLVIRQPNQHKLASDKKDEAHDADRDELRNVITALNNSTATMSVFAQTQADRTATLQELANKQDRVSLVASNNAQMLDRNLAEYRTGIEQLSTLVRNLVGGQRASNNGGG